MTDVPAKAAQVVALNTAKKAAKKAKPCPICNKPSVPEFRPFCGKRCADVDLGKWLNESYRVPTEETPGPDGGFDGED